MIDINAQIFWPYCITAMLVAAVGVYCILATYNLIRALIGIEILIKAATLLIILAGYITGRTALAQALVITVIIIEVVIMVVAGGVVLGIFKNNGTIDSRELRNLKG
jgi:multisubunit Na+/H+ antiporter MnhC subunit